MVVNNDHQIDFLSPQDGEFINYTVTAQWYWPLQSVYGEVEYLSNQYYFFHHLVFAWNDPFFVISGK
jgi:hypothetical protein